MSHQTPEPVPPAAAADLQVRAAIHDANQLLWVIQGQASLLLHEPRDPGVAAVAERIVAAARDAGAVLRPLLGSPEAGTVADDAADDLAEILWSTWHRCLAAAAARGQSTAGLRLDAPPPPGPRVAVSGLVVARLLTNLLANAIEAMTTGQVTCRFAAAGDDVTIDVQDDGRGLPPAVAAAPFAVGQGSDKPHGHGIGLAGCRQLAREHGGELELLTTGAPGAAFRLRLPAATRRLRVLAVDDEPTVREMLAEVLAAEGHEVLVATGESDVRAVFAAGALDVILLDYRLPGRSGLALAEEFRRADEAVAVVLMTGWGPSGAVPDLGGAVDFAAPKPLDMPALQILLQRAGALTRRRRRPAS